MASGLKYLRHATIFLLLVLTGTGVWLWHEVSVFLETAPETPGREVYFDVPAGAHLGQIARELANRGLITSADKFVLLARYEKMQNRLQAGRFLLNTGWQPARILDMLVNGKPALYRITIQEGLTWQQTAKLLEESGFVRYADFEAAIKDPEFLRHYGIPFSTAEGFLMPDTYFLRKPELCSTETANAQADDATQWSRQSRSVAGRLIDNFWRKAAALWPRPAGTTGAPGMVVRPATADLRKWAILASIVEKETGVDSERARVAGVYENRLNKNMLLQADPTVIYGMGDAYKGTIRKSDLANGENRYNTYVQPGLPPGPICSFGTAALKAAISPEKHDYLYFVASGSGPGHVFSATYTQHEAAVRDYRKSKRNK